MGYIPMFHATLRVSKLGETATRSHRVTNSSAGQQLLVYVFMYGMFTYIYHRSKGM